MVDIEVVQEPSDEEAEAVVAILGEHGETHGIVWDRTKLHIVLRQNGKIVGGLIGDTVLNWLFIGRLAVAPELRGKGFGRKLMLEAEKIARSRGCEGVWLDTFSFQAPDFYRSLGYREFGRLDHYPGAHSRFFFAKYLNGPADG
jgi:ribosomal protein S18 acetylase RimI-like enzyme